MKFFLKMSKLEISNIKSMLITHNIMEQTEQYNYF